MKTAKRSENRVLVYNHIPDYIDRYERLLKRKRPDITFLICRTREDIERWISQADIILSGHSFPVDFLPAASNLKWIQSISAGVENYVFSGKIPQGVFLTKIKGVHGAIMAEYVLGYILAVTLNMKSAFRNQEKREWTYYEPDTIRNKIAGIAGLGSVGTAIAYRLHRNGMSVIGCDEHEKFLPFLDKEFPIEQFEEFLGKSDFVILTLPLSPSTKEFFGRKQFHAMKEKSVLINVSRGALIQEPALVEALTTGSIGGAILDVFTEEPLPPNSDLWRLSNVIITPHISGPSIPEDIVEIFLDNLARFERGGALTGVVDLEKGY